MLSAVKPFHNQVERIAQVIGENYFRFPGVHPNSLVPKFMNKYNKDLMNHMKKNQWNILLDFPGQRVERHPACLSFNFSSLSL